MKDTRFYLILVTLIFFMVSCQKDQEIETTELGTEFFISNDGYTSLDTEVTFSIENQQKNLSKIAMEVLGITDADDNSVDPPVTNFEITLANGEGTINITSAQLGMTEAGWSADYSFKSSYNGKSIERFGSLSVKNPMSLTSPYIWTANDDGDIVETAVTVYQNDDVQYIKYDVSPKRATVEAITIETKVNSGDYTEVAGSFDPAFDSLAVVGSNYNANDTVYYRFTATSGSGTHEQSGVLDFIVNTVEFANTGGATLDTTSTQGFDLVGNQIVPAGTDTTDLKIVTVLLTSVGFVSNNGTLFVASDEAMYNANDVVLTKAAFDAGTQESGFASVEPGDFFIYKTMRGTEEHYGIIKITAAYLTQNGAGDYLEFEYIY
ncbi:MAG: hypothetical protein B6D61_13210 [Bacteroidetes bacterium 4484_249]|nr:MAG: hypothetical protein B6D61_13210 [Bacteroidetes bacterium 4484_249]